MTAKMKCKPWAPKGEKDVQVELAAPPKRLDLHQTSS